MSTAYVSIQNAKDVLEQHPKFKEALRSWQIEKAIQGGATKDIAEAQISDYFLELVLLTAPRSILYDFFDDLGLYMFTTYSSGGFLWNITILDGKHNTGVMGGDYKNNRKEAEVDGWLRAIEIFEKWEEKT